MVPSGGLARGGNRHPGFRPGRDWLVFRSLHNECQGRRAVGRLNHGCTRRPRRRDVYDVPDGGGRRQRRARDAQQSRAHRVRKRHVRIGEPEPDYRDRDERHRNRAHGDVVLPRRDSGRHSNHEATLVSGTAKQVCATVLLGGVLATSPTAGGTTASGTTANPSISISPASAGELAFAVLGIRGTTAPTAVTGTGATATSLYGIAPTQCAAAPNTFCGAGADMPFPGTAITWTDGNATDWVISAVRVLPTPNCGVASGNCYRIGAGGTWATGANWSNTSGGATCSCTPVATNDVIFNATPTGTTTLAAATTIASIDMTGFTGTLDTTASNWALTVNGPFAIQGTFQARSSTIAVTGDVDVLSAATIVNLGASGWTVNGLWTNLSTSASWAAGTSTVTIRDAASGTLTFAALAGGTNEFNNLTLDASVTPSITYTMAVNALRMGATLTIRNSTGGATGPTILTTSNLGITAGSLAVATFGSLTANGSALVVNGNVTVSAANGYVVMGSSIWTVTGTWTNASTSASWTPGSGTVTFTSATGGTMTFAGTNLPGNEFNNISFTSSAASAQTFTMATRALIWGGTLTTSHGSSTTAVATATLGLSCSALGAGKG